jgi:hypothetical protein
VPSDIREREGEREKERERETEKVRETEETMDLPLSTFCSVL